MPLNFEQFLTPIRKLHEIIRDKVVESCEENSMDELSKVARETTADTIYTIDKISEELIIDYLDKEIAKSFPLILIAEGLPGGKITLPDSSSEEEAVLRIIIDPIDGTRGLMYQKRSAWILTGLAPNKGNSTKLSDIEFAIQTEIPMIKQHLSDRLWAFKGREAHAERVNRLTGEVCSIKFAPSKAPTIKHGFATISRFIPGARDILSTIDEEITRKALGPIHKDKALCFEDQYICTGGQFYELMAGHDRFIADFRPLIEPILADKGSALGLCCHPYDVCTELIARELGVIITDENGNQLSSNLSVDENVTWIGYANKSIQSQIEPHLRNAFKKYLGK